MNKILTYTEINNFKNDGAVFLKAKFESGSVGIISINFLIPYLLGWIFKVLKSGL